MSPHGRLWQCTQARWFGKLDLMTNSSSSLPPEDLALLNLLRKSLHRGRATAMIGAGFSANANKARPSAPTFPLWRGLASLMVQELSEMSPGLTLDSDASIIAQHYRVEFGRNRLHQFLIENLPDDSYRPGDLHKRLLDLPWRDVFTTNYDTLLERSRTLAYRRRYDLVQTAADIARCGSPRIVKLNGSFPSHTPFVITEEDFLRYPTDFAPFVNTVQQALMESDLCMIGFSGEDPNFKAWTHWVRMNLGEHARPVNLIGVLDATAHQRTFYAGRNIRILDLGRVFPKTESPRDDDRHRHAMSWLLYQLSINPERGWAGRWPFSPPAPSIPSDLRPLGCIDSPKAESGERKPTDALANMQEHYPGWWICPHYNRTEFVRCFQQLKGVFDNEDSLLPLEKLRYWCTIIWYDEKCILSWNEAAMKALVRALESVNIMPAVHAEWPGSDIHDLVHTENSEPVGVAVNRWVRLALWVANKSIEAGDLAQAKVWLARAEEANSGAGKWADSINMMKWRCAALDFAFREMEKTMEQWGARDDFEWAVRRALVFLEMGLFETARMALLAVLDDIRQAYQTTDGFRIDWASLEAVVVFAVVLAGRGNPKGVDATALSWRQVELAEQNFSMVTEIKKYAAHFESIRRASTTEIYAHDIGRVLTSTRYGAAAESVSAHDFVVMLDRSGLLFAQGETLRDADDAVMEALEDLAITYPRYVLSCLSRIATYDFSFDDRLERIFSRSMLLRLSDDAIDEMSGMCIARGRDLLLACRTASRSRDPNYALHPLQMRMLRCCIGFLSVASVRMKEDVMDDAFDMLLACYREIAKWDESDYLRAVSKGLSRCVEMAPVSLFSRFVNDLASLDIDSGDDYRNREPMWFFQSSDIIETVAHSFCEQEEAARIIRESLHSDDVGRRTRAVVRWSKLFRLGYFGPDHALRSEVAVASWIDGAIEQSWRASLGENVDDVLESWMRREAGRIGPVFSREVSGTGGGRIHIDMSSIRDMEKYLDELATLGRENWFPALGLCEDVGERMNEWLASEGEMLERSQSRNSGLADLDGLVRSVYAYWRDFLLPSTIRSRSSKLDTCAQRLSESLAKWGMFVSMPLCVAHGWSAESDLQDGVARLIYSKSKRGLESQSGYACLEGWARCLINGWVTLRPNARLFELWGSQLRLRSGGLSKALDAAVFFAKNDSETMPLLESSLVDAALEGSRLFHVDTRSLQFSSLEEKKEYDSQVRYCDLLMALAESSRWSRHPGVLQRMESWRKEGMLPEVMRRFEWWDVFRAQKQHEREADEHPEETRPD